MINIIKQEIPIDESLKKKLEFICDFCNTTPTFINGSIRKIDKSNLAYVEPHKVIINNIMFLVFNYSNDVYIKNFGNKIKINELEDYLKQVKDMKIIANIDLSHILYGIIYILLYKIYFFNLVINNTLNLLMISQNYMILFF